MQSEPNTTPARSFELWAGVEGTVNRVGDHYFDQLNWNGHDTRAGDLDLFAALGIQAIRYPVLWERTAPLGLSKADWRWPDQRLARLRELGIRPIVGLVHHGSGPRDTDLIDPFFPQKLAEYACAVAERYPWVTDYTPVNEILTTARFSALYGHWYPHMRAAGSFARALVNQVRGVQLSMQAIRQVQPAARLVQTDDLGKTYSTPALQYQADYENIRRWVTFDLLTGRVDKTHRIWDDLVFSGISEEELEQIREEAVAPDILGINYYITSERFLDERVHLYPPHLHGGNGRDVYVDTEAVRACPDEPLGFAGIMREAWDRYHLPLAATEVHLGGHREQQVRWWMEAWNDMQALTAEGVDARAITAWALLGSYNWNSLVTRDEGHYESGVFDARSPQPRPTLLAEAIRSLAGQGRFDHPALDGPGWWHTPQRLIYAPAAFEGVEPREIPDDRASMRPVTDRPLLITGAGGALGQAFQRVCEARSIPYRALSRAELDIANVAQVEAALEALRPWAVINAAGYASVDDAEFEPELCRQINTVGPANLARACALRGIRFLSFSSDLVFNGAASTPYTESAPPQPINVYGSTKAESEQLILQQHPGALVVRMGALFGPWQPTPFAAKVLRAEESGRPMPIAGDATLSPTYIPDLAHASLDLLMDGEMGIWHMANAGETTWYAFARQLAAGFGCPGASLYAINLSEQDLPACRPAYSVLHSERAQILPTLDHALFRFLSQR